MLPRRQNLHKVLYGDEWVDVPKEMTAFAVQRVTPLLQNPVMAPNITVRELLAAAYLQGMADGAFCTDEPVNPPQGA